MVVTAIRGYFFLSGFFIYAVVTVGKQPIRTLDQVRQRIHKLALWMLSVPLGQQILTPPRTARTYYNLCFPLLGFEV